MSTLADVIVRDLFANRPAAGIPGRLFFASDTSAEYRDNGSSWDTVSGVPTSRLINTTAPLTGGGDLTANRTLAISNFTGDAGSGGQSGAVPAPSAGDAAAGKFLKADGSWAAPAGGGGGGTTVSAAPPYINIGGTKYVAGSGFLATLPSGTPTWINSSAPSTVTVGANGDVLAGDTGGPYFAIANATSAVEGEFSLVAAPGSSSSQCGGILIYDSTNLSIYILQIVQTASNTKLIALSRYSWSGTGAASWSADIVYAAYIGRDPVHFKLSVSGTTLSAQVSLNGGASFYTWTTVGSIGTITKGGYGTNNGGMINMLSLALT